MGMAGCSRRPGLVELGGRVGVAAAVAGIARQRRVRQIEGRRRFHSFGLLDALALRRVLVEVHALRRGVDDEDAARPQGVEDRRHLLGQLGAARRRGRTPMIVPHVADDHGRLVARQLAGDDDLVPGAAALEGLDARAQGQFQRVVRGRAGVGRAQEQQGGRRRERQDAGRRCNGSHERGSLEGNPPRHVRRGGFHRTPPRPGCKRGIARRRANIRPAGVL